MNSFTLKQKFIEFFKSKKHAEIPNVSLIPENDPTSLFIMAGMQPLVPYLLGQKHPLGKRLVNVQRSIRTDDIEEVGDYTHFTFFEMLGNWSLGDYFKPEAIEWSMEFLVDVLGLDPKRLYATVFEGDKEIPRDDESIEVWKKVFKKYGQKAEIFDQKKSKQENVKIFLCPKKDNFWGPAGDTGPCGPSSEIFYCRAKSPTLNFAKERPNHNDVRIPEIWNNVFMEYNKAADGSLTKLKQQNVDTGLGFERLCTIMQFKNEDGSLDAGISPYETDLFDTPAAYLRSLIEDETKKSSGRSIVREFDPSLTNLSDIKQAVKSFRIILDHVRACTFLIADGIEPSNKDQGYILKRLIRRMIRHARLLQIKQNIAKDLAELFIEKYKVQYPHLATSRKKIIDILEKEEINFEKTIEQGIGELDKLEGTGMKITGKDLFYLYETHGFPAEIALDELGITEKELRNKYQKEFETERESHQKKSRKGAGKFKGGLADATEVSKRYHTATHLLLRALQMVLGDHVHQRGSNITAERLRFDFSHPEKLTPEQLKQVEKIVNEQIEKGLDIKQKVISKDKALKIGAECEFPEKYPDTVTVYSIDNFSKELCGGPHVANTKELAKGGKFKIIKEESCGSGVRRIKAVLQ